MIILTLFFGLWCLFVHTCLCVGTCVSTCFWGYRFFRNDVSHCFYFLSLGPLTYLLGVCICAFATVLMWKSEDNLQEKVLSFYHVVLRHRAWQQTILPTEASHQLIHLFIFHFSFLFFFFFETGSFHWLITYQLDYATQPQGSTCLSLPARGLHTGTLCSVVSVLLWR